MNCPNCGSPGVNAATEWHYGCGSVGSVMKPFRPSTACQVKRFENLRAEVADLKASGRNRKSLFTALARLPTK